MKINRFVFSLFLISLFIPCFTNAQTIKYVAFFPVPYITHMKIESTVAYFALRDEGKLEIQGNLSSPSISASKDLDFSSASSTATNTVNLTAGSSSQDENTYGDFVVVGGNISFSSFSSGTDTTVTEQLSADGAMQLKAINWGNNIAFQKGTSTPSNDFSKMDAGSASTTGIPNNTTKLCWSPLRIKGTFEYQYYLIAHNGNCP